MKRIFTRVFTCMFEKDFFNWLDIMKRKFPYKICWALNLHTRHNTMNVCCCCLRSSLIVLASHQTRLQSQRFPQTGFHFTYRDEYKILVW